ncbi:MAG: helix-turn-helix domain-containing protein [Pseudomonadales bacterium]|nr:helix-turn-helix domain-containing protein [Pseudomonadales bacterium]
MYFGEKLRRLRQERNWTQPDLAEKLGIEQSWLSKIENDKSIPSSELLEKIAGAFGLELPALLDGLDPDYVAGTLSSLPEVRGVMQQNKYRVVHKSRNWIITGSISFALGIAMLVAGASQFFFTDEVYRYESEGVVYSTEPENLFHDRDNIISSIARSDPSVVDNVEPFRGYRLTDIVSQKQIEIARRENYRQILRRNYVGSFFQEEVLVEQDAVDLFGEPVAAGSVATRVYFESGTESIRNVYNSILNALGIFLSLLGFLILIGERRLARLAGL